jgi:hypothetical protein
MRRLGGSLVRLGLLVAVMLPHSGCQWFKTAPDLRPPKQPENYTPPPDNDPRFSSPVKYPDRLLNQDMTGPKDSTGGLSGPGMGSGGAGRPAAAGTGPSGRY